jgi:hypothetical protein
MAHQILISDTVSSPIYNSDNQKCAGRMDFQNCLSTYSHLPDADRKFMTKVRKIAAFDEDGDDIPVSKRRLLKRTLATLISQFAVFK